MNIPIYQVDVFASEVFAGNPAAVMPLDAFPEAAQLQAIAAENNLVVTGSAHCALVPYWAARLKKDALQARQISARGGDIDCHLKGDRVEMTGRAATFLVGEVMLSEKT